jgi:hypothetical protein
MTIVETIKASTPSLSGEEARELFLGLLSSESYTAFTSDVLGFFPTTQIAESFVSMLAVVDIPDRAQLKVTNPLHILSFPIPQHYFNSICFVYSNGLIQFLQSTIDSNTDELIVFISKDTLSSIGVNSSIPVETIMLSTEIKKKLSDHSGSDNDPR